MVKKEIFPRICIAFYQYATSYKHWLLHLINAEAGVFSALLAKKAHYRLLADIIISKSAKLLLISTKTNQHEAIKTNKTPIECKIKTPVLNKSLLSKTYTDE